MLKIMAPVSSYDSAVQLIAAGAEELYLGSDEGLFRTFSFTGRGKVAPGNIKVLNDDHQLRAIVKYAHARGIHINFLGNIPYFNDGVFRNKQIENYFWEYIEKGMDAGVDSVVVGDIGLLKLIGLRNYPIKLHASLYFKTINEQQVDFLKKYGVARVSLSYHVTREEITSLCKQNEMDIEVVGYLGCSFFNGSCSFIHDMGEGVLTEFYPGAACKGVYRTVMDDAVEYVKLFDAETCCAICQLGELDALGVKALKIVGRERKPESNCEIVAIYKKYLDYHRRGLDMSETKEELPNWWKEYYCKKKKCKYSKSNADFCYVIGG